jgi:hypothetical protein
MQCPKCGKNGVFIKKQTVTHAKGHRYQYEKWYVFHREAGKQRWCYLSKVYLKRPEIRRSILLLERDKIAATQNATQNVTQNYETPNNRNSRSNRQNIASQWWGWGDLNSRHKRPRLIA